MARIKITSNPYQESTTFQSWDEIKGEWIDIDQNSNSNSRLLSAELRTGFFPFKVRQIVDVLINEYGSDTERVSISK